MSYLVLARKYRPQRFEEVIGQEHVTRTLANAFEQNRVHHAFLFCGPRGVGKTTAARILARALCCEKGPTAEPCGVCDPCQGITAGTAVDYFEIDGASNNSVDDVRELRDGVKYQPAQLRRKIYVIDEVHMLSTAAFNALLKTLEEPPPHVTFIFATTEVHKIPVTILSRCQRYDFKLVPHSRLVDHLRAIFVNETLPVEEGALALLAREAGGSVRDMLSLADQVIAYAGSETITEARVAEVLGVADRALLLEMARAVTEGDPAGALQALASAVARGVDLAHLARSFLGTLRDLAVVRAIRDPAGLVEGTADELRALSERAEAVTRPHLILLFDRFARACEELARSPAPRLVLEIALVDMAATEPLEPLSDLVGRLEDVQARLGGAGAPAPRRAEARRRVPARAQKASDAPAAASSPRPAAAASPPADPLSSWEKVLSALEERSLTLSSIYAHARLLSWDDRAIELGYPPKSLHASMAGERDNLDTLKAFLAEHLGRSLDVRIKTIQGISEAGASSQRPGEAPAAAQKSVVEVENERRQEERRTREAEARAHPATKTVLDVFGASIKEIKVDG